MRVRPERELPGAGAAASGLIYKNKPSRLHARDPDLETVQAPAGWEEGDTVTTIYAKTPKGQQELEQRGPGLSLRARRLLILLDGKRDRGEVATLVADSEFDRTLALLVEQGYAEARGGQAAAAAPPVKPPPVAARETPLESEDPRRVEMARNFMLNSLMAFYGPHEKLSLKTSIQQSRRQDELRGLYDDWLNSITATRAGKMRAEELQGRLRAVL